MKETYMRVWDDDGEFETSALAAVKEDGTIAVFYEQTRRKRLRRNGAKRQ